MIKLRASVLATLAAGSTLLAACGAVGNGNKPESAAIKAAGETLGAASTQSYVCLPKALGFILTFSKGDLGDYASVAKWVSSDEGKVKVSNGDIAINDGSGLFYAKGVLVPQAAGAATITGTYLGFTAKIIANVDTIGNLKVTPATADLAPGSLLDLQIQGELAKIPNALDTSVTWAITAPNTSVVTIGSTSGTLTGVAAGGPLVARATFPSCSTTVDVPVNVSNLSSLSISPEFGTSSTSLALGTTEYLSSIGTLDNGATQNLTGQATLTSADNTLITVQGSTLIGMVSASTASTTPVAVTSTFGTSPVITSPSFSLTPVSKILSAISLSPTSVTVPLGRTTQFVATGTFTDGSTQPISRHVNFVSSVTTVAAIGTSIVGTTISPFAGLAIVPSTATVGASTSITAVNGTVTSPVATLTTAAP